MREYLSSYLWDTTLAVEGEARVDGPVWIRIEMPWGWSGMVQYPVSIVPDDFGCNLFEVRHNGTPVPPIRVEPLQGGVVGGPLCGNLGFEHPVPHMGRLPLHLKYPATYAAGAGRSAAVLFRGVA